MFENVLKLNYYIYIVMQTLYSVLCKGSAPLAALSHLGYNATTLAHLYLGSSPIPLCRSSQALSGWMGSVTAQLFSGLSRDVRPGSSPGSGWDTQGHSETCPEATPALSWKFA